MVADDPLEDDDRAVFRALERRNDVVRDNTLVDQPDVRLVACPPAYGRKEGDFVSGVQEAVRGGVFLVYRDGDGAKQGLFVRKGTLIVAQDVRSGSLVGQADDVRAATG